ncbi:hypothetical protein [uncultured Bartonella sp.]|uniref:hypothetical protein n=1 Tax=uncultured Bartonella sp. TaxID=104108 RepID=UPI0026320860|nr:hypothetical protein [uncultured Bartonella sp.]
MAVFWPCTVLRQVLSRLTGQEKMATARHRMPDCAHCAVYGTGVAAHALYH